MTKEEFIKKYNNISENIDFASDLDSVINHAEDDIMLNIILKNDNSINIQSTLNDFEVMGHLDMVKMAMRNKIIKQSNQS